MHDDRDVTPSEARNAFAISVQHRMPAFTLDVRFTAPPGITLLVGPSGSGKTMTLRIIAGLLQPDAGRVVVNDVTLFDSDARLHVPARARRLGYVFQQYALFPHMTVGANIAYGLRDLPADARADRVATMLGFVGLSALAGRMPRTLSGGQQQRVALVRALAPEPRALLLDEPLSALDAPLRRQLGEEILALQQRTGVSMLIVTHDPEEASRLGARAITLLDGGVVRDG